MKKIVGASITRTAIWVALLSIVPAMAIIVASAVARYNDEIDAVEARAERFVRTVAARQVQVVEVMETLSRVLAGLRDVHNADTVAATALFQSLTRNSNEYSNIFLLGSDGTIIASANPVPEGMNFSSFAFFRRATRRGSFSVGTVADSLFRKAHVLYFGVPVHIAGDEKPGVLGVSMRLTGYEHTLSGVTLPADASIYLLDGTGALAAAHPQPGPVAVGAMLGGEMWRGLQNERAVSGNFFIPNETGEDRTHVTYRKLLLPDTDAPYFYVLYTRPESVARAGARSLMRRDISIFAFVGLFSIAAAVGLCAYAVRRPWRALFSAAMRVREGDLTARVPEKGVGGEIGLLGKEFNAMADALEKRDAELSAAREHAEFSRNAKSEFLANMSHEIRTSMNAILGMAYLVLKTELTARQKGYISKLLAAANALLRVINDILDFSKMEAGKMSIETISFSLRRILSNVRTESAARLAEKHLGFTLNLDAAVPDHLVGDPLRLSQALMMLVDDAVTRSERGDVVLSCGLAESEDEGVTVVFTIHDAGVGLTPVQLAQLRELLDNEEEEGAPTMDKQRLRLAIASRLFRLMGGRITVESVFGEGVTFSATAKLGHGEGELRRTDRLFEGRKALIVDPSKLSGQDLTEILDRFGFVAANAPDMETARTMLRDADASGSPFSVVFADWKPSAPDMPEKILGLRSGAGLTVFPRVILTTPPGRTELPVSPEGLTVDALLPKPVSESIVFDTLMTVLGVPKDAAAPHIEAPAPAAFTGLRVLLAEDNAVNQQIAAEIMESEGIHVTVAPNGEDAVTLITESAEQRWDIVLMDLQMPKMDGFAATRAIRAKKGFSFMELPVIAMTANSDVSEISACFDAGMNDHTGKPIMVDAFFATLRRWLPVNPAAAAHLAAAVRRMREALTGDEPDAAARALVDSIAEELLPVIHEGRVAALHASFAKGEAGAAENALDELDALARGRA